VFGSLTTGAIILTVGLGVAIAVGVAYGVGILLDTYKVQENLQNILRDIEFTAKTGLSSDEPVPIYNYMW